MCSELLQREVREAVDVVEDPERHQGLHRVQIQLREADVQIQQRLPKEQVKRHPKPLEKIVPVYGHVARRRSTRLVGWPWKPKLHIIKDMIKLPEQAVIF